MKGITCCGECADYDHKKHRCKRGANLESNPQDKFYDDCPLPDVAPVVRCKDCKHGEFVRRGSKYSCRKVEGLINFCDFYCKDGVRKESGT